MSSGSPGIAVLVSYTEQPLRGSVRRSRWMAPPTGGTVSDAVDFGRTEFGLSRLADALCVVVNGVACEDGARVLCHHDDVRLFPRAGDPGTVFTLAIAVVSAVASAMLAPRIKAGPLSTSSDAEGQQYGFDHLSINAKAGDPIPVVFGERERFGGKVIAKIPRESADGTGDTSLRMLICLGHGIINRIGNRALAGGGFDRLDSSVLEGIYLNHQPISNFPGVKVSGRFGTPTQNVIPGFGDVELLREVGVGGSILRNTSGSDRTGPTASGEAVLISTTAAVDAVVIRVRFPGGLYTVGGGNQLDVRRVQYRSRHRLTAGPGAWSAWTVWTLERADQAGFFSSPRLDNLGDGGAPAARDIQVERVTAEADDVAIVDAMTWDSMIEVQYGANNYPGMALVGIELVASEQLTSEPSVSFDVEGLASLRIWDGVSPVSSPVFTTGYSANPAWHALEALTNTTWGAGVTYGDSRIDLKSLIEWAQYCDEEVGIGGGATEPRFRCDLVMGEARASVAWVRTIAATARCLPVTAGGLWRFIVDRPQATAAEVFGDGSIAVDDAGVARLEYTREYAEGGFTRPNQLICQIEHAEENLEPDVVVYPEDDEAWLVDEIPNAETVRLDGVTSFHQMYRELQYRMGKLRFQTRSVEFVTTRPAVALQPGDRFDLASSLTGWGLVSGRLRSGGTTTTIRLDRTVTLAADVDYVAVVMHPDGTEDRVALAMAPGTYAAGETLSLAAALSAAPAEFAEYVIGQSAIELKPFLCTGVSLEDGEGLLWRIRGVEYIEAIYEGDPATITLPNYSSFHSPSTPPGPLESLTAREIQSGEQRYVELSWRQAIEDEEHTSTFRIYRRKVGTQTWILVPGLTPGRRAVIVELTSPDVAYEFVVTAVSIGGAWLSPYDPRHPIGRLILGLAQLPPPPPTGLVLAPTAGNTYTLSWDPEEDAVEYQVLTGGEPTALPNDGAEDCLVLARTAETEITGLELTPDEPCRFYVRSVGANGRLSFTAEAIAEASPDLPAGESIKDTRSLDLSAGTGSNTTWNAGAGRLELTSPATPGVWTSDEIDTGTATLTELTFRPDTANDADDPTVASDPFTVPSIAADQWGIVDDSPDLVVGMLMPPWPDAEQAWAFEVRTFDGSWTAWEPIGVFESVRRTFEKYQLRVTMTRARAPYRPALRALVVVCTN